MRPLHADPAPGAKLKRGELNVMLHVLVEAVVASERGERLPTTESMAEDIGCVPHAITMAFTRLEKKGIIRRLSGQGETRRIEVLATERETA